MDIFFQWIITLVIIAGAVIWIFGRIKGLWKPKATSGQDSCGGCSQNCNTCPLVKEIQMKDASANQSRRKSSSSSLAS